VSDKPPLARVLVRQEVQERISTIRTSIDKHRGENPQDDTGRRVQRSIINDLVYLRHWPWTGTIITGMGYNWRQRRVGTHYIIYYYVTDDGAKIYLIELRHTSQRPLKPSTIRKYKGEIIE
jgi:plasmid stabilization system protein ParE